MTQFSTRQIVNIRLTGSVINMDMMGHKNSSGAPASSSSSSLEKSLENSSDKKWMTVQCTMYIIIGQNILAMVSPVLTGGSAHQSGQVANCRCKISTANLKKSSFSSNFFFDMSDQPL